MIKKSYVSIDINALDCNELEQLQKILYSQRTGSEESSEALKAVAERIAFFNGWMSKKKELEYLRRLGALG